VHIAPSFGADDMKAAKEHDLGALTLVDKQGKFTMEMGEFAGRYVKPEYNPDAQNIADDNVDVDIVVKLKKEDKLFKSEKYEHSYPHCWRTDKPILYYPLDSWFVKTTAVKEKLIALNQTINWKPKSTGSGRFENWLENLVDWNLSRSRYWGTPLPIWRSEDGEEKCIGSLRELKSEIEKSVNTGFMNTNPLQDFNPDDFSETNYQTFDLHRPYVDEIILVSSTNKPMKREADLIDVWFDSGAMPYAQFHYPFENKHIESYFPADYISEGVDQTRGWFFTLHAIATMVFDSVSYKTCLSHGLVLDKNGNKMSKRLGNAVNPFEVIDNFGADSTRWYMVTNSQPWENLKFDMEGVNEIRRKFFGTLFNTYSFFALYANIDNFKYLEEEIEVSKRPELDRWIISELNTLIKNVKEYYEDYDPTKAGRAIQYFVTDHLSNWYVRLSRRIFWKGEYSHDKISAYQTLYKCLTVVTQLMSPIAPFFSEQIFRDLNNVSQKYTEDSVHLTHFPDFNESEIDKDLEERMGLAQKASSMILSLRKKENIRVRQPLNKILIPVLNKKFQEQLENVKKLILSETNVKDIEYLTDSSGIIKKKAKPNFKTLGPKYGKMMKTISEKLVGLTNEEINQLEAEQYFSFSIDDQKVELKMEDVEIISEDIPGWQVASEGKLTVALDITITTDLANEGLSREFVNRIQNLRKDKGFEVTDHIIIEVEKESKLEKAIIQFKDYICTETLADNLSIKNDIIDNLKDLIEIEDLKTYVLIKKQ